MKQPKILINALVLVACDLAAMGAAFLATYAVRVRLPYFIPIQPLAEYIAPVLVLMGISVAIFLLQGLYRDVRDLSMLEEYAKIIKSLTYAFLFALALTFFLKLYERSRVLVVMFWATSVLFLLAARFAYYRILRRLRARGWDPMGVVVVGSDKKIKAVCQMLRQYAVLGYHVVSTIVLPQGVSPRSPRWLRRLEKDVFVRYLRREIQGVIVSDTVKNYQHVLEVNELFEEHQIPHRSVTEAFDLIGLQTSATEGLEGLLGQLDEGQIGGGYKVFKRFVDEVIAPTVLLLTAPVWLAVIALIKLDSRGPIFFRQERVGYHGRKFSIYKFRSMHVHAPKYAKTPRGKNDPRITRIGRWLRSTSLDELPQLINVIKGDMSLVGPRPEMPFLVEKYKPIYRYRLLVLPGLTGLWQVSGRTDKPLEENIKYDLYYIKKQSFLLDMVILLRTIPVVLFGRGAY